MGDRPDSKSKRYDRQIRIWGAEGQQRLESSRIALLNCSPTGAETLKNLVLGGIASFTIVDGNKVTAWDLGNNFLVDQSRIGQSRAQAVTDLLKEMNDSVSGSYVEDTPEQLLESRPEFLAGYDLVIATQVGPRCCIADRQCVACMGGFRQSKTSSSSSSSRNSIHNATYTAPGGDAHTVCVVETAHLHSGIMLTAK